MVQLTIKDLQNKADYRRGKPTETRGTQLERNRQNNKKKRKKTALREIKGAFVFDFLSKVVSRYLHSYRAVNITTGARPGTLFMIKYQRK